MIDKFLENIKEKMEQRDRAVTQVPNDHISNVASPYSSLCEVDVVLTQISKDFMLNLHAIQARLMAGTMIITSSFIVKHYVSVTVRILTATTQL